MSNNMLVVCSLTAGLFSTQVVAAEGKFDNQGCFGGQANIIQEGDSFTAGSFDNMNVRLPDSGGNPLFPLHAGHCVGSFTVINGELDLNGSCEFAVAGGDKFWVVFARKGNPQKVEGNARFIGGTGKYAGISGEAKFKQIGEVPIPGTANSTGGCDHVWGTYTIK